MTCSPIFKNALHGATIADGADYFGTDISPTNTPTTFLIYYVLKAGGANGLWPKVKRVNGASIEYESLIQGGSNPTAGVPSLSQIIVSPGDVINLTAASGLGNQTVSTVIVMEVETAIGVYTKSSTNPI